MNNYIRGWGKSWESSRNTLDSIVKSAPLVKSYTLWNTLFHNQIKVSKSKLKIEK